MMSEMLSQNLAQARSNTYRLFGQLFLHGLTADSLPFVNAIPELASTLPDTFDSDNAAADHFHLFGLNLFPFESIFLHEDSLPGTALTQDVATYYRLAGFDPEAYTESPDHIGIELALLAFLSGAESDAHEDDQRQHIQRIQDIQRRFLDDHLLPWLLPLVQAIQRQQQPFYAALATLTLDIVSDHRAALGADLMTKPVTFRLPSPPDLLQSENTGLKDIATHLLTPVYSGFYLSRDDVARLARHHNLPHGFGNRQQMLANLLHAAADYDRLPALLSDLDKLLLDRQQTFETHITAVSPLDRIAAAWHERIANTRSLLDHMQEAARP